MTDNVWLIGNKGMLGTELALLLGKSGVSFSGTDREVDITDPAAIENFINSQARLFTWIINCAAYTAVDKAEDDMENCRLLNTAGAAYIASAARKTGAKLIHISTDYVFNGRGYCAFSGKRPYSEDDETDPAGVYGLTKRDGEVRVLEENAQSYIIRTAWLYGRYGNNFVHSMLRLMKERDNVSVVDDQWGSPTWTFDLAEAIGTLLRLHRTCSPIPYGIYHYTGEGETTWYNFAREIYTQSRALGILTENCDIKPCSSVEFPARVKRPAYSVLDKTKIKKALGLKIPGWETSLKIFLPTMVQT